MTRRPLPIAAVLLASAPLAIAPLAAADPPPWRVERVPIELSFEATGRVEAAESHRLRLVPEAFRGTLIVEEVLHRGGAIEAGATILRFETGELERQLERALVELAEAQLRFDLLIDEQQVQEEGESARLERLEKAAARAAEALAYHLEVGDERQLRGAELRLLGSEDGLRNQRQELEQLEAMYAATSLADETKDIVLERSRRSVARAEENLALSRLDHDRYLLVQRAERSEDLADTARSSARELAHARINERLGAIRRELARAEAQRRLEDQTRRVQELDRDLAAMTLRAPASGVLTAVALRPGDTVNARQTIAEVLDTGSVVVPVRLGPAEFAWVATGLAVSVSLPEMPAIPAATGEVVEVLPIGSPDGRSVRFPARVRVGAGAGLPIGIEATVAGRGRTAPVLAVPADAIDTRDGTSFVRVRSGGVDSERAVTTGRRGGELVEIRSGVSEGEAVVRRVANGHESTPGGAADAG
jgi:multidrug resistance efflux pump